uniref:Uncharacterized protein n=1 Tax=Physcomitrium patens TaxID=3218 RepID=A0A2K1L3T1_PHYPA|nr:hypothetical protein PHYPA_003478 [Physcomitrium patens]
MSTTRNVLSKNSVKITKLSFKPYIQIHEIQPNNELHSSNSLHLGFEPTVSFKITETQLQAKKSHQLVSTRV